MSTAVMRLVFDAQGDAAEAARQCEADVFFDRFGNTPEQIAAEYGPYDAASVFLAVLDGDGVAQAAARLVRNGPAGLKTINDLAGDPWNVDPVVAVRRAGVDPANAWEAATFAVRRGVRRRGYDALEALIHGLAIGTRVNGIRTVTAVIDEQVLQMIGAMGLFFQQFPGTSPGPYLGSPRSSALYAHVEDALAAQRRIAPGKWHAIETGEGIAGITVPTPESMRLQPPDDADVATAG